MQFMREQADLMAEGRDPDCERNHRHNRTSPVVGRTRLAAMPIRGGLAGAVRTKQTDDLTAAR